MWINVCVCVRKIYTLRDREVQIELTGKYFCYDAFTGGWKRRLVIEFTIWYGATSRKEIAEASSPVRRLFHKGDFTARAVNGSNFFGCKISFRFRGKVGGEEKRRNKYCRGWAIEGVERCHEASKIFNITESHKYVYSVILSHLLYILYIYFSMPPGVLCIYIPFLSVFESPLKYNPEESAA